MWALAIAGVLWGRALQAADPLAGDLDGDGRQTVLDLIRIVSLARTGALGASPQTFGQADVNQDGVINDLDAALLGEVIVGKRQLGDLPLVRIHETSPAAEEVGVSVTRETVLYLTQPLAENAVVDINRLFANASGRRLLTRVEPARDHRSLTLFYLEPLPGNSQVRVTFDGTGLKDFLGRELDLDGDGQPGGNFRLDFSTLSLTPVANSSVVGRVFASEMRPLAGGGTEVVNQPLPGVIITVDGREETLRATTDALGNFRLEPVPAGEFFVHIDGRAAPLSNWPNGAYYPFVGKKWNGVAGQAVNIGDVFLPMVIAGSLQPLKPDEETIVKFPDSVVAQNPAFAGVSLTVPAGALFGENGGRGGKVGIAPVAPDRLPGPLPPGVNPALVITIQTDGNANFDRPVPACFPNLPDPVTGERLPAGAKSALWSFNHDTGRFEIVGPMTVSDDGTLVCTDPGVGILAPGWHFTRIGTQFRGGGTDCNDPNPKPQEPGTQSTTAARPCNGDCPPAAPEVMAKSRAGDPVLLFSGEFVEEVEDLRVPGRGFDFVWQRKYRSRTGPNTVQGNGWDYSYNVSLEARGKNLLVHDGGGRADEYSLQPDGKWTAPEFFREINLEADGRHILTFEDRGRWIFHPFDGTAKAGRLVSSEDRHGNRMTFAYDANGRLAAITDTLGREFRLAYDANGMLASVTDFTGRAVRYRYHENGDAGGSTGDLKSVTSPAVTGMPNGNDFPAGKTTTYTYTRGFADERLNHNLLTVTDGRRNDATDSTFGQGPYLVNFYSPITGPGLADFDRVVRQWFGGGVIDFTYVPMEPAVPNGFAVLRTIVNDRNGQVSEHFFDAANRLVRLREFTGRALPDQPTTLADNRPVNRLRPDDPAFFETIHEWTDESLLRRTIHPNGNRTERVYESDLNPRATARSQGNLRRLRRLPGTHQPAGDQSVIEQTFEYDTDFGGCCGFNHVIRVVDGQGKVTQHDYNERGDRIRTRHRDPAITESWEYNEFGQLAAHVLPDNGSGHHRRDEFHYHDSGPQRGYLLKAVVDAGHLNLATQYDYDAVGNVVRVTDPRGHDARLVVNQLNQPVRLLSKEVREGSGIRHVTDLFYDANNNLVRQDVQNRDDQGTLAANAHFTTTWEFDLLNCVTRIRREAGPDQFVVTEFEYDANRNRVLTRQGEAAAGRQPANVIRELFDERNLPYRTIRGEGSPEQSTSQFDYDRNGNRVRAVQGLEGVPRIYRAEFDGFDRLRRLTDPLGNEEESFFDANSRRVRTVARGELRDESGASGNVRMAETIWVHDAMERVTRKEMVWFDPATQAPFGEGQSATRFSFAANGETTRVEDPNGHARSLFYDTAGRLARAVDAAGNEVRWEYDGNANVVTVTEIEKGEGVPEQTFVSRQVFDSLNRVIRTTDPAGYVNEFGYDSRGNRIVQLDALRATAADLGNRTTWVYDGLNRPVELVRFLTADGTGAGVGTGQIVTRHTWDDSSRLVASRDSLGNTTTYQYDALNRRITTVNADGTRELTGFDPHDNPIRVEDANGTIVIAAFDLLDRVTRRDVTPGTGVSHQTTFEQFAYDGRSRLVLAENDSSRLERTFDSLSQARSELQDGREQRWDYDTAGNRIRSIYPGGRDVRRAFDELNRLRQLADVGGELASYSHAGPNRVIRRALANGIVSSHGYDADRRLNRLTHSRETVTVDDRQFGWNAAHLKVLRQQLPAAAGLKEELAYDSAYRLNRSARTSGAAPPLVQSYALDAAGNRQQVTVGDEADIYTLDAAPELADSAMNQYSTTPFDTRKYDGRGNLVSRQPTAGGEVRYGYDYRNRLVSQSGAGAPSVTYRYDALGRRIAKRIGDAEVRYFYEGWQLIEEQGVGGDTRATWVYGRDLDEVVTMRRAAAEYWYLADDLNSVVRLTDQGGATVETYGYDDFGAPTVRDAAGQILDASAVGNPWMFTGRFFDPETGFYEFRRRHYDPQTGRFISRDPAGGWFDERAAGNAFTYAGNSPASFTDPWGLSAQPAKKFLLLVDRREGRFLNQAQYFSDMLARHGYGTVIIDTDNAKVVENGRQRDQTGSDFAGVDGLIVIGHGGAGGVAGMSADQILAYLDKTGPVRVVGLWGCHSLEAMGVEWDENGREGPNTRKFKSKLRRGGAMFGYNTTLFNGAGTYGFNPGLGWLSRDMGGSWTDFFEGRDALDLYLNGELPGDTYGISDRWGQMGEAIVDNVGDAMNWAGRQATGAGNWASGAFSSATGWVGSWFSSPAPLPPSPTMDGIAPVTGNSRTTR